MVSSDKMERSRSLFGFSLCFPRLPKGYSDITPSEQDEVLKRKGAGGTSNITTMDGNNSSKISGLPRRVKTAIKRTKSTGKFDKQEKIRVRNNEVVEGRENMSAKLKPARSHESLVLDPASSQDLISLAGSDFVIRPLHSSILGQDHCFQITTSVGSKYYSCRSNSERDKWIESILSAIYPDKDNKRRLDSSLNVWVMEGKNLPGKKRYFCEICLDDGLYARTTPKFRTDMLFWGEQFNFSCLPDIGAIKVHVYKEIDKKRRRDKNYVGQVTIPVEDVNTKQAVERWFPLDPSSTSSVRGDPPTLRIKARYQSLSILPLSQYSELAQYLKCNAVSLCHILEQEITVKVKEEVATCLVKILQCLGTAKDFLIDIVFDEMENIKEESLVFRANTMATKSMEAYMKLIGAKYLRDTLNDFVQFLYDKDEDLEVDPTKLASGSVHHHQAELTMLCEMACCKILNSPASFPAEIRMVFHEFRTRFGNRVNGDNLVNKLISGCIFLRFLCPAIMSPSLFNLIQEFPSERTSRCLTLIAKTTQALANFTRFGAKESYMVFMNEFLEREWGNMTEFLNEISTIEDRGHLVRFDGYIDLGRELALLHSLLSEAFSNCEKAPEDKLSPFKAILANISANLDEPGEFISYHTGHIRMSRSFTTANSTTTVSGSLKKIFEDRENREVGDVEMLPPYNIAMDRTITTSSTVNSLVDFIQKDGENSVMAKLERESRMTDSRSACRETDNGRVERTKEEEIVRRRRMMETSEIENGTTTVTSSKSELLLTASRQSYSVSAVSGRMLPPHAAGSESNIGPTTRVLPLSFSNPAFHHFAGTTGRPRDVSPTDSGSSVNSEGASSNADGDVSHTSSSSNVSPESDRKGRSSSGAQQLTLLLDGPSMSNRQSKGQSNANENGSTTNDEDRASSQMEANHARKTAFFASVVSPSEEKFPSAIGKRPNKENTSSNNVTESSLHILGMKKGEDSLPSFAITIQNPAAVSSIQCPTSLSLPLEMKSSPAQQDDTLTALTEQTLGSSHIQSGKNVSCVEIKTNTETNLPFTTAQLGIVVLENSPTRSKPIPAPSSSLSTKQSSSPSKVSPPRSPNHGVTPRPKIRTELASKAKPPPDVVSSYTRHVLPDADGYFIHTKKTTHVQSCHKRTYMVQEPPSGQDPVWTRRSLVEPSNNSAEESTKDLEEVQYEIEIQSLKMELDRVSSQLAEAQLKLEEEGKKAEEAMEEMRVQMLDDKEQLQIHCDEKEEKDRQIRDIIDRLMSVEDDLKRGQDEMQVIVSAKQKIIEAQERRIESLDTANLQLMNALEQLKERYKVKRRTKSQGDLQVSTVKLSLSGNYTGSKC